MAHNTENMLTVGELIAQLEMFNPSTPIVKARPSGDYWHTTIAGEVDCQELGVIQWSEYHRAFKVVQDEGGYPPEELEDGQHQVVII